MPKQFSTLMVYLFALKGITAAFMFYPPSMPTYQLLLDAVITYAIVPLSVIYLIVQNSYSSRNVWLCAMPVSYWLILLFHTYGGYRGYWLTALIPSCVFLMLEREMKIRIFNAMYRIMMVCNVAAVGVYIWRLSGLPGLAQMYYYSELAAKYGAYYFYFGPFAVLGNSWDTASRLCGIFNEPGGLGTICSFLYIVKYNAISLRERLILLITMVCTVSLAAAVIVALFHFLRNFKPKPKYIVPAAAIVAAWLILPQIEFENEQVNHFVSRMTISDGKMAGDNRIAEEMRDRFNRFFDTGNIWWGNGVGWGTETQFLELSSSVVIHIVEYGICGLFIVLGTLIGSGLAVAKRNKECLIFLAIFILSLYQRPNYTYALGCYITLIGGMETILWQQRQRAQMLIPRR